MILTDNQILNYIRTSKPLHIAHKEALKIGFYSDHPAYELGHATWHVQTASIGPLTNIDEFMIQHSHIVRAYLGHLNENRIYNWRLSVGFLLTLVAILMSPDSFSVDMLKEKDWSEDLASIVLNSASLFSKQISNSQSFLDSKL